MPTPGTRQTSRHDASAAELDTLSQYLNDLRRFPLLTPDEEIAVARRAHAGDERAMHDLVTHNLRFVVSVAKRYQGRGLSITDLISEGNTGLLTAARKFDPDRGVRFISYAVWWIRETILVGLARQAHVVRIPVDRTSDVANLAKAAELLRQQLGREPRLAEVAAACSLPIDDVRSVAGLALAEVSLDASADGEGERARVEEFVSEDALDVVEQLNDHQLRDQIQEALRSLPPREAAVLRLNFGLDGEEEHTLEAIGSAFGITRERVRQIRERALKRLRVGGAARVLGEFAA